MVANFPEAYAPKIAAPSNTDSDWLGMITGNSKKSDKSKLTYQY